MAQTPEYAEWPPRRLIQPARHLDKKSNTAPDAYNKSTLSSQILSSEPIISLSYSDSYDIIVFCTLRDFGNTGGNAVFPGFCKWLRINALMIFRRRIHSPQVKRSSLTVAIYWKFQWYGSVLPVQKPAVCQSACQACAFGVRLAYGWFTASIISCCFTVITRLYIGTYKTLFGTHNTSPISFVFSNLC